MKKEIMNSLKQLGFNHAKKEASKKFKAKKSNGQIFKEKHGISKTTYKNLIKGGFFDFSKEYSFSKESIRLAMIDYKKSRKLRKKEVLKVKQAKHRASLTKRMELKSKNKKVVKEKGKEKN